MHMHSLKRSHSTTTTSTIQAPSTTNNDYVYLYRGKNTIIAKIEQVVLIMQKGLNKIVKGWVCRNGRKGEKLLLCKKEVVEMAQMMSNDRKGQKILSNDKKGRYDNCHCPWKMIFFHEDT